jgi:enamine deaminase RidA (YjgF/YER057c/UK114 family)
MSLEARLRQLGLELPPPRIPPPGHVAVSVEGQLAWTTGLLPWAGDRLEMTGRVGIELSLAEGQAMARSCCLNALSALRHALGSLDQLKRVVKVTGFISSAPDFYDQSLVLDGASHVLIELLGDAGEHARSAVGASVLPRNAPVELELVAVIG